MKNTDEDDLEPAERVPDVVIDPLVNELYKASDAEIFDMLKKKLVSIGYDESKMVETRMYLYAPGKDKVALVAHADTVFKMKPQRLVNDDGNMFADYDFDNRMFGLGGDDRSGIYIIWRLLDLGHRPHVIITEEEETGCFGAKAFGKEVENPGNVSCLVEFDRHGGDEAVYYGCDNKDFEKFVSEHGFKTEIGRFSDIGMIAPMWNLAAVNLSIGVHGEHTVNEHVNLAEVEEIIAKSDKMLRDIPDKPWDYVKKAGYVQYFSWVFDDDDDDLNTVTKKEKRRNGIGLDETTSLEGGIVVKGRKSRKNFWDDYYGSF